MTDRLDANAELVMTTHRQVVLLITVSLEHAEYAKAAMRRANIVPEDTFAKDDLFCIIVDPLDQLRAERAIIKELT